MAATRTAPARRSPAQDLQDEALHEERFSFEGRAWLWREGPSLLPPKYRSVTDADRDALESVFSRKLVPQAEKRGIAGELFTARAPDGVLRADVRWVRWQHPEQDPSPLWGLFVQSHALGDPVASNDAWKVVAWGDGPALAWASDEPRARDFLRSALRAPPPWLRAGMASREPGFPVRIERDQPRGHRRASPVTASRRPNDPAPSPTAQTADGSLPEPSLFEPPRGAGARAVLTAWRRAHPTR
jgi:hypothetical protein